MAARSTGMAVEGTLYLAAETCLQRLLVSPNRRPGMRDVQRSHAMRTEGGMSDFAQCEGRIEKC